MESSNMEFNSNFKKIIEDMDNVIQSKKKEIIELDEKLSLKKKIVNEEEQVLDDGSNIEIPTNLFSFNDDEHIEQLLIKNQQIQQLLDDVSYLETVNSDLIEHVKTLKSELKQATNLINQVGEEVKEIKSTNDVLEQENEQLKNRNNQFETELRIQQKSLDRLQEEDKYLMELCESKLDSMKKIINDKDAEIDKLRSDNLFALNLFGMSGDKTKDLDRLNSNDETIQKGISFQAIIDAESKQKLIDIANSFREKDAQIELLKTQLIQATSDIERQSEFISDLNSKLQLKDTADDSFLLTSGTVTSKSDELSQRLDQLEVELEEKDRTIGQCQRRIYFYEIVLPSNMLAAVQDSSSDQAIDMDTKDRKGEVESLLSDINKTKSLSDLCERLESELDLKESRIQELVSDLNQLDIKFNMVQSQYESLLIHSSSNPDDLVHNRTTSMKESSGSVRILEKDVDYDKDSQVVEERPKQDVQQPLSISKEAAMSPQIPTSYVSNHRTDAPLTQKKIIFNLKKRILTLEEENVHLRQKLRDYQQIEPYSSNEECSMMSATNDSTSAINDTKYLSESNKRKNTQVNRHGSNVARLHQLEQENSLLELAMKEILLSIKTSDSSCNTIMINCPSLERLCQIIESRYLNDMGKASRYNSYQSSSSDLFQMITLKAELDLIRGQNDQLRKQIKLLHADNLHLVDKCCLNANINGSAVEIVGGDVESSKATSVKCGSIDSTSGGDSSSYSTTSHSSDNDMQLSENCHNLRRPIPKARLTKSKIKPSSRSISMGQHVKHNNSNPDSDSISRPRLINTNSKQTSSIACQTEQEESDVQKESLQSLTSGQPNGQQQQQQQPVGVVDQQQKQMYKCSNCSRLTKISGQLLQCIVRIENNVSVSEQIYLGHMDHLHKQVMDLVKELSIKESMLNEFKKENHLIRQQKSCLESRIQCYNLQQHYHDQQQMNLFTTKQDVASCNALVSFTNIGVSNKSVDHDLSTVDINNNATYEVNNNNNAKRNYDLQAINELKPGPQMGDDVNSSSFNKSTSLTNSLTPNTSSLLIMKDPRLTITLLQAIISCLQARLDYKEDRLRQIEATLSSVMTTSFTTTANNNNADKSK